MNPIIWKPENARNIRATWGHEIEYTMGENGSLPDPYDRDISKYGNLQAYMSPSPMRGGCDYCIFVKQTWQHFQIVLLRPQDSAVNLLMDQVSRPIWEYWCTIDELVAYSPDNVANNNKLNESVDEAHFFALDMHDLNSIVFEQRLQ